MQHPRKHGLSGMLGKRSWPVPYAAGACSRLTLHANAALGARRLTAGTPPWQSRRCSAASGDTGSGRWHLSHRVTPSVDPPPTLAASSTPCRFITATARRHYNIHRRLGNSQTRLWRSHTGHTTSTTQQSCPPVGSSPCVNGRRKHYVRWPAGRAAAAAAATLCTLGPPSSPTPCPTRGASRSTWAAGARRCSSSR